MQAFYSIRSQLEPPAHSAINRGSIADKKEMIEASSDQPPPPDVRRRALEAVVTKLTAARMQQAVASTVATDRQDDRLLFVLSSRYGG